MSKDSGSFNSEEENENELEISTEEWYNVAFSLNCLYVKKMVENQGVPIPKIYCILYYI